MNRGITLVILATLLFLAFMATGAHAASLALSWTDNSNNEDVFHVERCQGQGCTNFAEIANTTANTAKFLDSGLPENTTYGYRVRASNSAGFSAYTNIAYGTTLQSLPNAPSGLQAMPLSSTSSSLQWDNPDDAPIRLTRVAMQGSASSAVFEMPAGSTNYIDVGLRKNTSYCYSIEPMPAPENYAAMTACVRTLNR